MNQPDPAEHIPDRADSMQAKAERLMELFARADENGAIHPALGTAVAPDDDGTPGPEARVPEPADAGSAEAIRAAEQSGDWATAQRLKAARLVEIAERLNGPA
ncbi:hypothetical protein [Streptomyces sp. N35]|uniref:hypothetical protein n=1 Tax=Streptomyces sp. N35 TaxID=2795730 RepID=UPI0018F5E5A5|nr:hypothetical protein [Streptomyces sp. N35]